MTHPAGRETHAAPPRAPASRALVLMGGGARTAYQVGVLRTTAILLAMAPGRPSAFPFQVLVGTSAGALNAACLASAASEGLHAFERLAQFWAQLRCDDVYRLQAPAWIGASRLLAALRLWGHARRDGAILDNMPLVDTLHRAIPLAGIEASLQSGAIEALAVTASSYTSGEHWTFCHTLPEHRPAAWRRPGRRAEFQPVTIEHLMASSAIPFLFPPTPLWVDGRREFFGDGSMRQVAPLSPAVHLGARQVLVIGAGQPARAGLAGAAPAGEPSIGDIVGHAMGSVFHDTLQADVEQTGRISRTLQALPREAAGLLPFRDIEVLAIQPSRSLDALAHDHLGALPVAVRRALGGADALRRGSGSLASYLLFEPGFVQALVGLGEHDAYARRDELLAFFGAGGAALQHGAA